MMLIGSVFQLFLLERTVENLKEAEHDHAK
jgi:hypothetical protein